MQRMQAPSCWTSEEDDLEESSLYNIALYRFCDICVKALCKEGHRKSVSQAILCVDCIYIAI